MIILVCDMMLIIIIVVIYFALSVNAKYLQFDWLKQHALF